MIRIEIYIARSTSAMTMLQPIEALSITEDFLKTAQSAAFKKSSGL
jgi:hypothetical protein